MPHMFVQHYVVYTHILLAVLQVEFNIGVHVKCTTPVLQAESCFEHFVCLHVMQPW